MFKPRIVTVLLNPTIPIVFEQTIFPRRCPSDPINFVQLGRARLFRNPNFKPWWGADEQDSNLANPVVEKCFKYAGISNYTYQKHNRWVV